MSSSSMRPHVTSKAKMPGSVAHTPQCVFPKFRSGKIQAAQAHSEKIESGAQR